MVRKRILSAAVVLVSLGIASAAAQDRGQVEGRVTRQDGRGIGGVTVVIDSLGEATLTDNGGNFRLSGVPAGTYSMTFTLIDNVVTEGDVDVVAGQATRIDKEVDWAIGFAESITVMSASRRAERIVDAPAAISVVTEEQIEREASHGQLPKLIEFTPGAEVTQSGIYDFNVNTRGFNSSLTRRVATLVDGRDPSVPFLGAQEWAAISFPLDDLAGAEFLRGPSAALYGANASSGVLNLVTKAPRDSAGGLVRLTAGELSTANLDFRYAGSMGSDWYVKLLGGVRTSGDFAVSRNGAAEYSVPCTVTGQTDCLPQELVPLDPLDDDEIFFGGLRFDKYLQGGQLLTFEGGYADLSGPPFQTGIGRVQLVDINRPWARINASGQHWNLLGTYTKRDASEQTALSSGANLVLDTEAIQLEAQGNWGLADGKARIVIGASYAEDDIDSANDTGVQTLLFEPVDADFTAVFGQLDWNATDNFKLVFAGRWDDSSLHDSQFSPKASAVWGLNPNHSLRFTYNEAFQVANYSEFFLQAPVAAPTDLSGIDLLVCAPFGLDCGLGITPILALGNESLELEEIETFEVGYSGILGGDTFLTIDYYNGTSENFITDLIPQLGTALGRVNPNFGSWQQPAGVPDSVADIVRGLVPTLTNNLDGSNIIGAVSYGNFGEVDIEGIDFGLTSHFNNDWTLSLSYSWFDFEIQEDLPGFESLLLPNTPENKLSAGIAYVGDSWDASLSGRWVDDFRWAVGPFQGDVESYTTIDLSVNWQVNDSWILGVNVANLLDEEHWESFGGDLLARRALGSVTFRW